MIDFANKAITTKSDLESEQLLKKAVAQGFGLPKGEKALITNRFFRFIGSPYKQILIPATISHAEFDQAISYTDLFGDPETELRKIVDSATRWCRAYGYEHLSIFAKYDTNQLQEIAEHLLTYCNAQERGCVDACCENYKSESV